MTFYHSTFVKADFEGKTTFLLFFASERNICLVFSEIEMMEDSSRGTNFQPSQANFIVLSSFQGLFFLLCLLPLIVPLGSVP